MHKTLNKLSTWFADKFSNDTAGMLICTGAAGWILSSLAQIGGIILNKDFSNEQKSYMVYQEFADAIVNIGSFTLITLAVKKYVKKLFETGKIIPKNVLKELKQKKEYKDKIGKLDFNINDVIGDMPCGKEYNTYKDFGVTTATVGASILATNVVTPIVRNMMATKMQDNYIKAKQVKPQILQTSNYHPNLKI